MDKAIKTGETGETSETSETGKIGNPLARPTRLTRPDRPDRLARLARPGSHLNITDQNVAAAVIAWRLCSCLACLKFMVAT